MPVLRPKEDERLQRWRRVLEWYGFRESERDPKVDVGPRARLGSPGVDRIVVLDADWQAPARLLAGVLGRPVQVSGLGSLKDAIADLSPEGSVLLVGRPD